MCVHAREEGVRLCKKMSVQTKVLQPVCSEYVA